MVVTISVPLSVLDAERLGEFIGIKGVNIKNLEQKHKVIIRIHADDPSRITASVIGNEFDARLAQCDLQSSAVEIRGRQLTHTVSIPTRKIGVIIGKKGSYFRQVKDRCNVRLHMDKDEEYENNPDDKSMSTLRIQGSFEGILLACNMFYDRLTAERMSEEDRFENRSTPHFMSDWGAINDEKID